MESTSMRHALLEELAAVAYRCRHLVRGDSAEAGRFQELVAALWSGEQADEPDSLVALLTVLRDSPSVNGDGLYARAAALIPV